MDVFQYEGERPTITHPIQSDKGPIRYKLYSDPKNNNNNEFNLSKVVLEF